MRWLSKLVLGVAAGGLSATGAWAAGADYAPWNGAPQDPFLRPASFSQPAPPPLAPVAGPEIAQPTPPPATPMPPASMPSNGGSGDVYDSLQGTSCSTGACNTGACGDACNYGNCFSGGWFAEVDGLIMTRNQPNKFWTTYDQSNNALQILNTEDANIHWDGGVDVTVGYRFCCECGIEAEYWGIYNMNAACSVTSATNNLGTPMDTTNGAGSLLLGGQTPDQFFTNAHEALIWRHDDVNNVEVNFLYNPNAADCCSHVHATWLIGFRLFNFDENLLWTSVAGGFNYGQNGGADQANLDIQCTNLLAGAQFGAHVDFRMFDRLSLTVTPLMGIYGNHAENDCHYYRGDGVVGFDIEGSKDTVSFIGQVDLGLKYDINQNWSVVGGYRVMVATGIALADNQIPHFLAASDEFADVKVNGELVLHGVYAGVQCCW